MNIRKTVVAAFALAAACAALAAVTVHRSFRNRDTGYVNGAASGGSPSVVRPAKSSASSRPAAVRGKAPNKVNGAVSEVQDGGLVTVSDRSGASWRVALAHIEAPKAGQPFGPEASKFLSDLTSGKEVEVLWTKKRADGAVVGELYYRHEKFGMVDANLTMVKNGAAWHALRDAEKVYAAAEKEARAAKRGLWAAAKPVRPSLWEGSGKGEK